jgi:hypothetical protein
MRERVATCVRERVDKGEDCEVLGFHFASTMETSKRANMGFKMATWLGSINRCEPHKEIARGIPLKRPTSINPFSEIRIFLLPP